jgi:hypothetical protein
MNLLQRVWDALEAAGCNPRGPIYDFTASCPCPGHGRGRGDRTPSLHVSEGADDRVLAFCRVGCQTEDVLDVVVLTWPDLFPEGHPRGRPGRPLPPARPGHLQGPWGALIDVVAAGAALDQRMTASVMLPRCFSCGAQGAWLRVDRGGTTLDCSEGCTGGQIAAALARLVNPEPVRRAA